MFTLKLYRNGPLPPEGKTVIVETAGLWITHCDGDVKHIRAFKDRVGVEDKGGTPEFYVGGQFPEYGPAAVNDPPPVIRHDNYYSWGVLENAQGKTTEMFR